MFDDETLTLYGQVLESAPLATLPARVNLGIAAWLAPSSFEVAMMARLQTMLSEGVFENLQRSRNTSVVFQLPDPEAQKIWEEIQKDRMRVFEQAVADGSYERRLSEEGPPS